VVGIGGIDSYLRWWLRGLSVHIPKSYIHFAMGLSVFVEMVNLSRAAAR
jgi:hypothetical protein